MIIIPTRLLPVLSLVTLVLAAPARADQVILSNGDRISGQITQIHNSTVFIKPPYMGEVAIRFDDIIDLQTEESVAIELDDGSRGEFTIQSLNEAQQVVATANNTTLYVDVDRFVDFQTALDTVDWESKIEVNNKFERGDSESEKINVKGQMSWDLQSSRARFETEFIHEEVDTRRTRDYHDLDFAYDWEISGPWFFNTNFTYQRDEIAELDYRYTTGGSLGYDFFDYEHRKLSVQLGPGTLQEQQNGVTSRSNLVDWRLRFSWRLFSDKLELYHNHRYYRYLGEDGNNVIKSSTGTRFWLNKVLYLNAEMKYDFDSSLGGDRRKDRITFLTGVGADFD